MVVEYVIVGVIGFLIGTGSALLYKEIQQIKVDMDFLADRIIDTNKKIISPEALAKQILTMKMPLDDLPPELLEQIKEDAELYKSSKKSKSKKDSEKAAYFG